MSDDLIASTFGDLDAYYPNSKRKRRSLVETKSKDAPKVASWDSRPYVKPLPNGKDIELFTAGALASALGRPFVSIKVWNEKGYLPTPPYRLPTKKTKHGEDHKGRRLYSRAMIEKTIEIFAKAGLLDAKRIEWAHYRNVTLEIAEAWAVIKNEEMQ
jgi:hypothetical protein